MSDNNPNSNQEEDRTTAVSTPPPRRDQTRLIEELTLQLAEISQQLAALALDVGERREVLDQSTPPRDRAAEARVALTHRSPSTSLVQAQLVPPDDRDFEIGDTVVILNNYHRGYQGARAQVREVFVHDLEIRVLRDNRPLLIF